MKIKLFFAFAFVFIFADANARQVVGDFPKIQFGNMFVSADEVCVDGTNIKTINKVTICQKWAKEDSTICIKEITRNLSTTISYLLVVPIGEGNYETISRTIPLSYRIGYGYKTESGNRTEYFQDFSIPNCERP